LTWLVVNADDAGLAASTDAAILRCAREGIVRAATVVANGPTAAEFVAASRHVDLDLGLHVNLTEGRPLTPCPGLAGPDGRFPPKAELWRRAAEGLVDADEVRAEVAAQRARLEELGVTASHVDGHNHVHLLPAVRAALAGWDVWVRVPLERGGQPPYLPSVFTDWARELEDAARRADAFAGFAFCDDPSEGVFLESVPSAGVVEFMVHPGAREGSPFASSALREREVETLCSPRVRNELERRGVRVAGFREAPCG
jgi:predicted glycoside hydrolase/deacetylase ChbG (UPF0249 family)